MLISQTAVGTLSFAAFYLVTLVAALLTVGIDCGNDYAAATQLGAGTTDHSTTTSFELCDIF